MIDHLHTLAQAGALAAWRETLYLGAAVLFVLGIRMLRSPRTARRGNAVAALGMLTAVLGAFLVNDPGGLPWALAAMVLGCGIGAVLAARVQMTQMPQMVALFNGFGGAASAFVAVAEWTAAGTVPPLSAGIVAASVVIGSVTLSGSLVAAGKLHGTISGKPIPLPSPPVLNGIGLLAAVVLGVIFATGGAPGWALLMITALALTLGITLTLPIGGADMPVMVSLLNSYSGLAASAAGFLINNNALIVSGALVGASGLILTAVMCKAMNRSLGNVLFAGVGGDSAAAGPGFSAEGKSAKFAGAEDMAIILDSASRVLIVPGYGMAVAQAQHAVRELADSLGARGVEIIYGVHSVAGRMPGHMNVLLAEADVPYEQLLDTDQANAEVEQCDAAVVIGANDVVNPAARHDTASPIYGMPIINVDKAQTVFVLKRSLGAGYAGVDNELFFGDNTLMVLGDAKQTVQGTIAALKDL